MPDCSTASNHKLQELCRNTAEKSRVAAIQLATISGEQRAACLRVAADTIRKDEADILKANLQDLAAAPGFGLTEAATDRLRLDSELFPRRYGLSAYRGRRREDEQEHGTGAFASSQMQGLSRQRHE